MCRDQGRLVIVAVMSFDALEVFVANGKRTDVSIISEETD